MSAIVPFRPGRTAPTYRISLDLLIARSRVVTPMPSALDRLVARYVRSHAMHVSPIVGCYLCLHDQPRVVSRELPVAA